MNKNEFLTELKYRLRHLPPDEIENAVSYYEEYFNEAGEQYEQHTITELGSPMVIASKIIGEYTVSDAKTKKKKEANPIMISILAICASPIAIPIAAAVAVLILAMFITIAALEISGAAVVGAGMICIIGSFWAFSLGFPTGLFFLGMGILSVSIGVAIIGAATKVGRLSINGLQKSLGRLLIRRGTK